MKSAKEKKLLKKFGFTPYKAFKILVFSFVFSSIGFSYAAYVANVSLSDVKTTVVNKLSQDLSELERMYKQDYSYDEYLLSREPLKNKVYYKHVGSRDLSLNKVTLNKVKAQKKKISASTYLLRYKVEN